MENELRLHSPVGAEPVVYTWPLSSSVRAFCKFDQYTFVLNFPFFHVHACEINHAENHCYDKLKDVCIL